MSDSTTDNAPAPAPAPEVVDAAATAAAADATDVAVTAAAAAEGEAAATTEGTDGADADAAAGGGGAPADGGAPAATDQGEPDPNTGWLPLESNPDIVNPFAHDMGMPKEWSFCDIYGLEDWAFDMVRCGVTVVSLFCSVMAADFTSPLRSSFLSFDCGCVGDRPRESVDWLFSLVRCGIVCSPR